MISSVLEFTSLNDDESMLQLFLKSLIKVLKNQKEPCQDGCKYNHELVNTAEQYGIFVKIERYLIDDDYDFRVIDIILEYNKYQSSNSTNHRCLNMSQASCQL